MKKTGGISTEQVEAMVELSRQGSLRAAAAALSISEQGLRTRLLSLEAKLGVELYHKKRGMRRVTALTAAGRRFLPQGLAFLERGREMLETFRQGPLIREVNVVSSQYLIAYLLIDRVREFHAAHPDIRVRLSARREQEIEQVLAEDPDVSMGVAAPYESGPQFDFQSLFSMEWSLLTPAGHRLAKLAKVKLERIVDEPLILYERGSTGRQHVVEAFQKAGLSPRVEMEATNTDLIVRMVEAGLGIALVPLLPSGVVTRHRKVGIVPMGKQIKPIDSGILTRRGARMPEGAGRFLEFVKRGM